MAKIKYEWVKDTLARLYGDESTGFVLDNLKSMGLLKTDRIDFGEPVKPKKQSDGVVSEFESNPRMAELLVEFGVTRANQSAWLEAYPDASYITQEFFKSIAWIEGNPKRKPKAFSRFFGSWLSRGWERHRKTIPAQQVSVIDWDKVTL